ncbi:hypothetical protein [Bdellovibrio bacteriovorus]|uniref:hypothetical protein n=1 Tax=Bdellovibrio bacteriovorus TaxID=959 RepID=UPI0035A81A48
MKKNTLILAMTLLTSQTVLANTSVVETTQEGPFSCENAESLAKESLENQCKAQGMTLKEVFHGFCQQSGDDGGYVNYYTVISQGTCTN